MWLVCLSAGVCQGYYKARELRTKRRNTLHDRRDDLRFFHEAAGFSPRIAFVVCDAIPSRRGCMTYPRLSMVSVKNLHFMCLSVASLSLRSVSTCQMWSLRFREHIKIVQVYKCKLSLRCGYYDVHRSLECP